MGPAYSIDELLEQMVTRNASDLHVTAGTPPVIRVRGSLERLRGFEPLVAEDTHQLLYRILSSEQQKQLEV
jgi:twitching motility protein PilT